MGGFSRIVRSQPNWTILQVSTLSQFQFGHAEGINLQYYCVFKLLFYSWNRTSHRPVSNNIFKNLKTLINKKRKKDFCLILDTVLFISSVRAL